MDYGLAQINNQGGEIAKFLGKTIKLPNDTSIKVTEGNFKTNQRINVAIGIRSYKQYVDQCKGNPFAAYAMYNGGTGMYDLFVNCDLKKMDFDDVIWVLEHCTIKRYRDGANKVAKNLKNNFKPSYEKWKDV